MIRRLQITTAAMFALFITVSSARAAINLTTTNFVGAGGLSLISAFPVTANTLSIPQEAGGQTPAAFMALSEGNWGGGPSAGPWRFAQSFVANASGKLSLIQFPITGAKSPVTNNRTFSVHVFNAVRASDGQENDFTDISCFDPNMDMVCDPFVPGTDTSNNLLTTTAPVVWNGYTAEGATSAVLGFQLTGADQVDVVQGKTYLVEFELGEAPYDELGNQQFYVGRNTSNAQYANGQAFRDRVPLNGNAARDIAMAFTISPAVTPLAADFNEDLSVNGTDLTAWRSGYGLASGAVHGQGDANADGAVAGADYLIWQRQFGQTPVVAAIAAVPEPSTVGLLSAAVVALAGLFGPRFRRG